MPDLKDSTKRRHPTLATCYHEAGHAVIGVVLKRGVLGVEAHARLRESPTGSMLYGWTLYMRRPLCDRRSNRFLEWCRREMLATMAGHFSTLRWNSNSKGGGSCQDWFEAHAMFEWLHRGKKWRSSKLVRAYREERILARTLVKTHWVAIVAVAMMLHSRHRLTGAQVRAIVKEAQK